MKCFSGILRKKLMMVSIVLVVPFAAFSQFVLSGTITDGTNGKPLAGAAVTLNDFLTVLADASGMYQFSGLKAGAYTLRVSNLGFGRHQKELMLGANTTYSVVLERKAVLTDEVIVTATRASQRSAATFTQLGKEELEEKNTGQDLPYLLQHTPSVVVTSDAGAGIGYTGIRIRGSDATRINLTINGIPLNDAESQGTFLVDLPDLASSVDNIQIQRGVGTSTNGAGAFGGSINVQTSTLSEQPYAELNNSAGSFNTFKNTLRAGSGLINNRWSMDTRLSRIVSDGFIDRGSSDLRSFFASGAYHGRSSLLRLNVFSGVEKTYQAWNGVPEAKLKGDQKTLQTHYYNNLGYLYVTPADSANLFDPSNNRTFNGFLYDNQTDNYQQDHYQALYSKQLSPSLYLNTALHYTYGRGYYEEYKYGQTLSDYQMDTVFTGNDTIISSDLIRRKWLDNDFYGLTYSARYEGIKRLALTLGGAYNEYKGNHFGEVIWSRYASNTEIRHRYYDNDAFKTDFNVFGKGDLHLEQGLSLFCDLQVRSVSYSFLGFDQDLNNVQQAEELNFFNPKAGISYEPDVHHRVYASFSVANKEPNRDDYTQSTPQSRPRPEHLQDWELGYRNTNEHTAFGLTYYYMKYRDQLILTGELNDVGAYIRTNIPQSYRTGIELEAALRYGKLEWKGNTTLSMNKVVNFKEFVDVYDTTYSQLMTQHAVTDLAFSPPVIGASELGYSIFKGLNIFLLSKYVGKQYLDNTSDEARKIDPYLVNDLKLGYTLTGKTVRKADLSFVVHNLLDEEYESGGYTYGYIFSGQPVRENFYYPQAGRHYMLRLNIGL